MFWNLHVNKNRAAQANVHQQMCTTGRPFQRLGGLLSNHPNKIKKTTNSQMRESALPKSFCNFFALSEMLGNPGKVENAIFSRTVFANEKNSLGTNIEHLQSRCMAGSAKKPSFLAIFCSSACARLLGHVRCPLNLETEKKTTYTTTTERRSLGELFSPQRKTFQAGGRYKNPIKPGKTYLPPKSFFFFLAKKSSSLEQVGMYAFFFPEENRAA